jgi:hypothetical protein
LCIRQGGKETKYFARYEPHPLGITVELTKLDGTGQTYHVALPKEGPGLCDHPRAFGEADTQSCKHIQALRAMQRAKRLPA